MFTLADILMGLTIALLLFSLLELGEQPMMVNSKPDKPTTTEKARLLPYAPINAKGNQMSFSKRQEAAPQVSKPVDLKPDIQNVKGPSLDVEVIPSRHTTDPQIDIQGLV